MMIYNERGKECRPKFMATAFAKVFIEYDEILYEALVGSWAYALNDETWVSPKTHTLYWVEYSDPDGCKTRYWRAWPIGFVASLVEKERQEAVRRAELRAMLGSALGEPIDMFYSGNEGKENEWATAFGHYNTARERYIVEWKGNKLRKSMQHSLPSPSSGDPPDTYGYCHGTDFEGGEW